VKSIHEESYVHNKEQLENVEMEQANTKKRKYGNDTLTSTESVVKVSKINAVKKEQKCEECNYKTHEKSSFKNHMKTIHRKIVFK